MKRILVAVSLTVLLAFWPPPVASNSYFTTLREASDVLLGKNSRSDVAQDFYGFRATVLDQDPYAVLGPALKTIGVNWDLAHASTHPPTAFLLVAPVAWMPWPLSSIAWAWLMVAALLISLHAAGYSWKTSAMLTALALLWPPTIHSLFQITILWLLGIMLAYHFRSTHPVLAGICLALASFTKLLPAIMLVPFVVRRNWRVVWGFISTWAAALAVILLLAPDTIRRYLEVNRSNAVETMMRGDNSSPIGLLLSQRLSQLELAAGLVLAFVLAAVTVVMMHRAAGRQDISLAEWGLYSYLSVALLPISWIYSIIPLLPILARAATGLNIPAVWAVGAIVLATAAPPFASDTRYFMLSVLLLCGFVVIARLWPELSKEGRDPDGTMLAAPGRIASRDARNR